MHVALYGPRLPDPGELLEGWIQLCSLQPVPEQPGGQSKQDGQLLTRHVWPLAPESGGEEQLTHDYCNERQMTTKSK